MVSASTRRFPVTDIESADWAAAGAGRNRTGSDAASCTVNHIRAARALPRIVGCIIKALPIGVTTSSTQSCRLAARNRHMHRKDDQYSPILFRGMENDVPVCEIVSAQKSVAPGTGRQADRLLAGGINPARKWRARRGL